MGHFPKTRLRRLRQHSTIRNLIREIHLDANKLVLPLFIRHGLKGRDPISSMPGHSQIGLDELENEIKIISDLGINSVVLFGIPEQKNALGTDAYSENGIIQTAIPIIKNIAPKMLVMSDICFCEYTDHGHCGIVRKNSDEFVHIDDTTTLELLAKQAVSHAQSGADIIAPSASMDGMVAAIRHALDAAGYQSIPILSYSVKYASALYGPFRQAAEGAPKYGDRRTYQMDFANANEAIRECALDIAEGSDMLMVKPAHTYLDIIFRIKERYPELPLCAYHTSGEYALIKAAAEKGWIDERKSVLEILTSIHRAGADFIITYFAKDIATWLRENKI